jgi:hypothetical protein
MVKSFAGAKTQQHLVAWQCLRGWASTRMVVALSKWQQGLITSGKWCQSVFQNILGCSNQRQSVICSQCICVKCGLVRSRYPAMVQLCLTPPLVLLLVLLQCTQGQRKSHLLGLLRDWRLQLTTAAAAAAAAAAAVCARPMGKSPAGVTARLAPATYQGRYLILRPADFAITSGMPQGALVAVRIFSMHLLQAGPASTG